MGPGPIQFAAGFTARVKIETFCNTLAQCLFFPKWLVWGLGCLGVLPAMSSLEGVAEEWEDSMTIRRYMRKTKKLVRPLDGDDEIHVTGKTAGYNFDLLAPLISRIWPDGGEFKMFTVPEIQHQKLD